MKSRARCAFLCVTLTVMAPHRGRAHDEASSPPLRADWTRSGSRFRLWEYAGTAVVGLSSYYLRYHLLGPTPVKWQGTNFFDDAARGWLRADTAAGRVRANDVSQVLSLGGYVVPFGIDLPIILFAHREPRVMWQVLMMDLEAFAVTGLINNALFYEVGRGRPSGRDCAVNPAYDPFCDMGRGSSFPSGHVVIIATGAGLTCVHHRYLPIYGDPRADAAACALMSLATVGTAVTRVMADRHYATDTLVGAAIGFGTGFGLPWLLHYRSGGDTERPDDRPRQVAIVPFGGPGQLGLGLWGGL